MPSILTDAQAEFLRREKAALSDLRLKLAELGAPGEDLGVLQDALLQLDELFLLVVAGEFNAGKSRLINTLLGHALLPEGVLPTTSSITVVRYGDQVRESAQGEDLAVITAPVAFLHELTIVDTPGTNAIVRRHEQLTKDFVPRADLVLFVTSSDRPFSESESAFLELIRAWGKKIVIVVNKSDILDDEGARREVFDYVRTNATRLLGLEPEVFAVSARFGFKAWARPPANGEGAAGAGAAGEGAAGTAGAGAAGEGAASERPAALPRDEAAWADSGFQALEAYILDTLHAGERLRLKLESPLGVAERVIANLDTVAVRRLDTLAEDLTIVTTIDQQLAVYAQELRDELAPRVAQVELILRKLEARGIDFFDNTIRLTKILELARGDRVRAAFERDVLADVPVQVEHQVQSTIDWLVEKDLRQWQQLNSYLQRRQAQYADQLVGQIPDTLDVRRRQLLDSMGESAQKILETYDRQEESRKLASDVETAVAVTALAEVGAVGLGAAVIALLTASLEPTGLVAAGTIALLGLFVIPTRRRQAKERFQEKIADTRVRLNSVLTTQFNGEAERSLARLREGVAPYTRFVRAERERLARIQVELATQRGRLAELRAQIGKVT